MSGTIKCVLRSGKHSFRNALGKAVTAKLGDVVELTPDQLAAFGDRFEELSVVQARVKVAEESAAIQAKEAADKAKADAEALAAAEKALAEETAKEAAEKAKAEAETAKAEGQKAGGSKAADATNPPAKAAS